MTFYQVSWKRNDVNSSFTTAFVETGNPVNKTVIYVDELILIQFSKRYSLFTRRGLWARLR